MPQTITTGYKALVDAAEREIETIPTEDAIKLAARGDIVLVDIRDVRELQREGRVPGAFHCPRGMLEFWIDPDSKYHKEIFAADKRFVFFCGAGQRSLWRRSVRNAWVLLRSHTSQAGSLPGRRLAGRSRCRP